MSSNKTKNKIKRLIESADYLNQVNKDKWLELVEALDDAELAKVYAHFSKSNENEFKYATALLVKDGRGKEVESKIKLLSDSFKKEGIQLESTAKKEFLQLSAKLDDYRDKTTYFIDKLTYPERENDKSNYLNNVRAEVMEMVKDKNVTKDEMEKYRTNLSVKSEDLYNRIIERQRLFEEAKFKEAQKESHEAVSKCDFDTAIFWFQDLQSSLSPLNKTTVDGDLNERDLRLDKKIQEQINELKIKEKIYKTYLKPDTLLMLNDKEGIIIHEVQKGKVGFSQYKQLKLGKNVEMETFNGQTKNWIDFFDEYKPGTFKAGKLDYLKVKVHKIEDKEVREVSESQASIAELRLLKEINYVYGGNLEKQIQDPKLKEAFKNALEENFNRVRLYFEKDKFGLIRPSEVYEARDFQIKSELLIALKEGFKPILENLQIENSLENEKDPQMKMFKEGTVKQMKFELRFLTGRKRDFRRFRDTSICTGIL